MIVIPAVLAGMILARNSIGRELSIGDRGTWISSALMGAGWRTGWASGSGGSVLWTGLAAVTGCEVSNSLASSCPLTSAPSWRRKRPRSSPTNLNFTALIFR